MKLKDYLHEDNHDKEFNEDEFYLAVAKMNKGRIDSLSGGLADNKKPRDYNIKELKMGAKVEYEHTDNMYKAIEIALDHLEEIPDYYSRLLKMEKGAEKQMKESKYSRVQPFSTIEKAKQDFMKSVEVVEEKENDVVIINVNGKKIAVKILGTDK